MKLQNVQLVGALAEQLTLVTQFHELCGTPKNYARRPGPEDKLKLRLCREDHTDVDMPVLRESALALVVAERDRIKDLMRKYGVEFPEDSGENGRG